MTYSRSESTPPAPAKRRRELHYRSKARKKHKRLDAIHDEPTASYIAHRNVADDDNSILRRSSRVRRPPDLLDSSPIPFVRRKRFNDLDSPCGSSEMKRETSTGKEKEEAAFQAASSRGEDGDWMSRLRTRDGNGREKLLSSLRELNASLNEAKTLLPVMGEKNVGMVTSFRSSRRWKKISPQAGNKDDVLPLVDKDYAIDQLAERIYQEGVSIVPVDVQLASEEAGMTENADKVTGFTEEAECVKKCIHDGRTQYIFAVDDTLSLHSQGTEENGSKDHDSSQYDKHPESIDAVERDDALKDNSQATEHTLKDNGVQAFVPIEKVASLRVKEGRRCGLCGCGTDGKPPKKLVNESFDSENEAYDGSTASDEPNYNVWDGFGDEPGWLGRLLGPLLDRFGIARVWVHQHCAVWSPEVYFADLGCLKNVRAALCRGRALKCSRCGRPGATIGCRVDRCPKTYHLPCSRIEGCIFDHHKFLIACSDHRRFFQPYGHKHALQIRKMKAKKSRLDLRKVSNEARRKDLEAEEKWLENCGEDEEFLRREGRRLHRDILRIAPIYIGGSSENENMYQGWESVAGLEHVIQCMKEVVLLPLLYPEFFINLGLVPPRGILLHGNPGTGKTHVVRALIGACSRGDKRIAYFARKGADCLGKYVGDAERQLRLLFQVAEKSQPSIIFFDEIDGLAPCRSKQQDQTHSSVVSTLLSLLDGLKSRGSVIVIGATNRPDAVDPALRRPGRFDREIYFPLPTEKDRSSILSLHTRSWPKPLSGSLLLWIANQTVGFAGADLQALCAQAAMYALKRNCALQKLLSYAAKGTIQGKLPSLPSFHVEERDWLAALTLVPPPCSRREAGIAVNDIVASPLPVDLVSCLLLPLAKLLVSLYIDEQVWLSPILFMASKSVKNVVVSALEQKGVPVTFWWSHLDALIQEPLFAEKIKNKLVQYGLVNCPSGFNYLISLDEVDDEPNENETVNSIGMRTCGALVHRKLMQKSLLQVGKPRGFRIIISGAPRCGQQHLASCLLQGFMGHKEILKVSLATISQEGHGDMILGLSHILLKCLDIEQCIIFMPRIDLWAIEETACPNTSEGQLNSERKISVSEGVTSMRKGTSEMWNLFVELVDSAVTAASLTIMATCEVEKSELSPGILSFFSQNVCGETASIPTECTIPRFFFHIGANLDLDLVITSAAEKLSFDIIQLYIKLVHEKTHERFSGDKSMHKCSLADTIPGACNKQNSTQEASTRKDNIASNNNKSLQESFPKAGRVLKGNLCSAISAFGHQILRCPKFAELVWVTSKLKEGPSTDANGPWKRWLFNTCVVHRDDGSPSKRISGTNPCNASSNYDMEPPGVVRGLIAVGLLACRGFYTSIWEISSDVRKVLELLVGQIREKMFGRKGQYRYFEVLSQVAYLDDMVNSWVYMLQSLEADSNIAEVNSKPAVEEDEYLKTAIIEKSCNATSDISLEGLAANTISNGEFSDPCLEELVDYIMLSNKSTDDSNSNCRYKCCPGCVIAVRAMARQIISDDLKKSNECCTTADDAHDIVTSCSMRVLDSFRKCFFFSANSGDDGDCYHGKKRMACGCESAGLLPEECGCHTSSSLSSEEESDKLTYFFQNGVLLQLAQQPKGGDPELHCKFESLCMCLLLSNDVYC